MLLSVSCGLEAKDQQVEYSLIRTFWLFKQILWPLDSLFHKKILSILNSYLNLNYFLCLVTDRVIESPM